MLSPFVRNIYNKQRGAPRTRGAPLLLKTSGVELGKYNIYHNFNLRASFETYK